jgi:hypothetical protein
MERIERLGFLTAVTGLALLSAAFLVSLAAPAADERAPAAVLIVAER